MYRHWPGGSEKEIRWSVHATMQAESRTPSTDREEEMVATIRSTSVCSSLSGIRTVRDVGRGG